MSRAAPRGVSACVGSRPLERCAACAFLCCACLCASFLGRGPCLPLWVSCSFSILFVLCAGQPPWMLRLCCAPAVVSLRLRVGLFFFFLPGGSPLPAERRGVGLDEPATGAPRRGAAACSGWSRCAVGPVPVPSRRPRRVLPRPRAGLHTRRTARDAMGHTRSFHRLAATSWERFVLLRSGDPCRRPPSSTFSLFFFFFQ